MSVHFYCLFNTSVQQYSSSKNAVASTQLWVKYGQNQWLGYIFLIQLKHFKIELFNPTNIFDSKLG